VAALLGAGAAFAEDVWVKAPRVEVLAGKGSVYGTVGTAMKGTKLPVVAREGKWIKVELNGKAGYVLEGAISPTAVSARDLGDALGSGESQGVSTSAAARGLIPAEKFGEARNLDTAGLKQLEEGRKRVTPQQWQEFAAAGKVGPGKPATAASNPPGK